MKKSDSSPIGPLNASFERGPTRYFHGRRKILRDFEEYLGRATQANGGTTFMVQGAPGAGKTALVYECEQNALRKGWGVASIPPHALWDSGALLHGLGGGRRIKIAGGSGKVGFDAVVKVEVGLDLAVNEQNRTVLEILEDGTKPLLLMLDEAQVLGKIEIPAPGRWHANSVLDKIHNGGLDRPVLLLAAGLGTTADAFKSLGVSRFDGSSFIELGALGKEPARAVIQDWLQKEGGAKGDPTEWIDAIAQETHGWPQHIQSYVRRAVNHLRENAGTMTPKGLHTILEDGRELRSAYYEQRAREFDEEHRHSFAKLFVNVPEDGSITRSIVMSSLSQDHGPVEAANLFDKALDNGILHRQAGRYVVPIPSMQNWLVSNYGREQIELPYSDREETKVRQRNFGHDLGGR
ncbi:MAG: ATP-binding protein [Rhodothermaceae bacterium]|nr:ATP-binding protein [Rhodothermaceae bacterium]MYC03509.1 ATP-binding protein [Rhodothermaceae bacterium]MYI18257.1 ATP-binding protein [Rhodothermaceae bacterium]